MNGVCLYCGLLDGTVDAQGRRIELRPYGPGGQPICFWCATETPEREEAAQAAFVAQVEAAAALSPDGVVAIGEGCESGPEPLNLREPREGS